MAYSGWPHGLSFQQGYFNYPPGDYFSTEASGIPSHQEDPASPPASSDESAPTYSYYVRMINPKKKSDYLVRTWHDETGQFKSPAELKLKLIDSFPNDVSSASNFQIGYFEPPGNTTKRWIVEKRDLSTMYSLFSDGSKLNLWCDRKACDLYDESQEQMPKKKKRKVVEIEHAEEDGDDIFHDLKEKHPKMEGPKLRLWAKLIQAGKHDSYETPPPIPLITGVAKPKKETLTDAVVGAASAIAKVLQPNSGSASNITDDGTKISPLKVASLRRSCLEDLKKLKDLLEDGVLTEVEFNDEKKQILCTLKKINK
jgi:hypothetical protein